MNSTMNKQVQLFFEKPELFADKQCQLYFVFCFREGGSTSESREIVLDASSATPSFPNTLQDVYRAFPRFLAKLSKLELSSNHFCAMKQIVVEADEPQVRVESYVMGYFGELVPKNV